MHQTMSDRSVRQSLLPFDKIQSSTRERGQVGNFDKQIFAQALYKHQERQKQQKKLIYQVCKNFNDPSFVYKEQQEQKNKNFLFKLIQQFDRKYKHRYPIISPESPLLLLWNLVMITMLYYLLIEISLTIFFVPGTYADLALIIILLIFLFLDLFVRANIGVYKEGKYITERQMILKQYISLQFWIDLFSWIVLLLFLIPQLEKVIYLKILFYVKIYSIAAIDDQIRSKMQLMRIRYAIFLVIRVIAIIIFIVNWGSTIYFAIDRYFYNQKGYYYTTGQLWLTNSISGNVTGTATAVDQEIDIIQVYPWYVWYNYAMYWAVQTTSGVGYGNITPKNPVTVAFVNICMLMTPVFFSFFINSIWEIVGQVQKSSVKYVDNMKNLKAFLKDMDLPPEMDTSIRDYYHQVWRNQDVDDQEGSKNNISEMLSKQLHKEFLITCKSRMFKIRMFQEISWTSKFQDPWNQIIELIAPNIQEEKLVDRQIIYDIGERDQHIYYLFRGNITLFIKNNWVTSEIIEGNNFGQQEFLTLIPRYHRAQASQYSKIAKISSTLLRNTLKQSNFGLYQKFCFYKQQVIFLKKINLLSAKCWKCESQQHLTIQCPNLNIWKFKMLRNRKKIDSQVSINNMREQYVRKPLKQNKINGSTFNYELAIDKPYQSENYYKQHNIY